MPIVLRYVDSNWEINEDGMSGLALVSNVEATLQEVGLPLQNCGGQGYAGASAMSSQMNVVSWLVLEELLKRCMFIVPVID